MLDWKDPSELIGRGVWLVDGVNLRKEIIKAVDVTYISSLDYLGGKSLSSIARVRLEHKGWVSNIYRLFMTKSAARQERLECISEDLKRIKSARNYHANELTKLDNEIERLNEFVEGQLKKCRNK